MVQKKKYDKKTKQYSSLDKNQRKAFIIMIAHFVMTYIEHAENSAKDCQQRIGEMTHFNRTIRQEKGKLKKLCRKLDLLCMFLNGPGGSGKSEVLKEVLIYGKEFCDNIGVPFTKQTILITASTGSAATLIKGSTIHAATYLFEKKSN